LYLRQKLGELPHDKPVVLVSMQVSGSPQFTAGRKNFLCGLKRVGVANRTVVIAVDEAAEKLVAEVAPEVIVLGHPDIRRMIDETGRTLQLNYPNRLAKVVGAAALILMNHTVLVTDTDTHWFQDPSAELMATDAEIVAMQDLCPMEFNSGTILYRPTPNVTNMFRTLFASPAQHTSVYVADPSGSGEKRRFEFMHDNDQYLLNCAVAGHAMGGGLSLFFLRRSGFFFNGKIPRAACARQDKIMIWHTSGSCAREIEEHGFLDLSLDTGKCLDKFMSKSEVAERIQDFCKLSS
jgi:hypothetical protein